MKLRRSRAVSAASSEAVVPHRAPRRLSPLGGGIRVPTFALQSPAASPHLETVDSWPYFGTSRAAALAIPSVSSCRDLIVGAVVSMAPYRFRGLQRIPNGRLLTQPDPDTILAATLAGLVEDLIYDGRGYWLVLARDGQGTERLPDGFPVRARWIPTTMIRPELSGNMGAYSRLEGYRIDGISGIVEPGDVIRFDSPIPGILGRSSDAIANALGLEAKAQRLADVDLPAGTLTNTGAEVDEDEADHQVERFETARREHTVAFLQNLEYERTELSAEDLQLVEARANAATEMARLHNVPVSLISASPSGGASAMLYSNLGSMLTLLVSNAVEPYLVTIEQRLSCEDVTPQGQGIAFDRMTYLRSDPKELQEYVVDLVKEAVISAAQGRTILGIPEDESASDLEQGTV